jgi:hypothetical protein
VVWPFGEKDPGVGMQKCLGGKLNGDESKLTIPYLGGWTSIYLFYYFGVPWLHEDGARAIQFWNSRRDIQRSVDITLLSLPRLTGCCWNVAHSVPIRTGSIACEREG